MGGRGPCNGDEGGESGSTEGDIDLGRPRRAQGRRLGRVQASRGSRGDFAEFEACRAAWYVNRDVFLCVRSDDSYDYQS